MQLVQPVSWFSRWAGSAGGLFSRWAGSAGDDDDDDDDDNDDDDDDDDDDGDDRFSCFVGCCGGLGRSTNPSINALKRPTEENDARCNWFSPNWHNWISRLTVCPMASSLEEESLLASLGPSPSQ